MLAPEMADTLDKAMAYHRAGRLDAAQALYGLVLEAEPDHVDALHLLGTIAYQRGDDARALELIGRALELDDRRAQPHYHLGLVLLRQGHIEQAAERFGRALAIDPKFALAHQHAGDAWQMLGKLAEAVAAYQQALMLDENLVQAWWGLGCAELAREAYAPAAESFQQVVSRQPNHGEAQHNLGKALFELGQIETALDAFRQAATLLKEPALPLGMIATVIPSSPGADPRAVLEARQSWATYCRAQQTERADAGRLERNSGRLRSRLAGPLRVGYVSAFFKNLNWMKPVWGLVNQHDRQRFEVHLFSDGPRSAIKHGYIENESDHFHDVAGLTNAELARLIEQQQIDVLVDLNGYSRLSRLPLYALRPAPVIVAWFNMYAASGMDCFDFLIGDHQVLLAGDEAFYREQVVCVPGCYLTFEVNYPVPDVAPPPCLANGRITFGCLAPQYKISTQVVEVWSRILHGCPGSRLILKNLVLGRAANRHFVHSLFALRHTEGSRRAGRPGRAF